MSTESEQHHDTSAEAGESAASGRREVKPPKASGVHFEQGAKVPSATRRRSPGPSTSSSRSPMTRSCSPASAALRVRTTCCPSSAT